MTSGIVLVRVSSKVAPSLSCCNEAPALPWRVNPGLVKTMSPDVDGPIMSFGLPFLPKGSMSCQARERRGIPRLGGESRRLRLSVRYVK
jgi:hypothetical protein